MRDEQGPRARRDAGTRNIEVGVNRVGGDCASRRALTPGLSATQRRDLGANQGAIRDVIAQHARAVVVADRVLRLHRAQRVRQSGDDEGLLGQRQFGAFCGAARLNVSALGLSSQCAVRMRRHSPGVDHPGRRHRTGARPLLRALGSFGLALVFVVRRTGAGHASATLLRVDDLVALLSLPRLARTV